MENGQYYFYLNDHLGTPQKLLDTDGNTVWEARYDAFGKAEILKETVVNNLRFPGQYFDAETGLHYNFHRYYDPLTGRYTQADPIGFDGGDVNWYAYVGNNPRLHFDSNGLEPNKSQAATLEDILSIISHYSTLQQLRYVDGKDHGKPIGPFGGNKDARYLYTTRGGWIDLGHFFQVAALMETNMKKKNITGWKKIVAAYCPGVASYAFSILWDITENVEEDQCKVRADCSKIETYWSYEDAPSNYYAGGYYLFYHKDDASMVSTLREYFEYLGAADPSNAPNWSLMQNTPQKTPRFPQNRSFHPWFTTGIPAY